MSTEFRVYIASLSDYNAGRLHGEWFDFTTWTSVEDLEDFTQEMLKRSPEAALTGFPSEEWAIHDYEAPSWGIEISEWESFKSLVSMHDKILVLEGALEVAGLSQSCGRDVLGVIGDLSDVPDNLELTTYTTDLFWDFYPDIPENVQPYIDTRLWLKEMADELPSFWADSDTLVVVYY